MDIFNSLLGAVAEDKGKGHLKGHLEKRWFKRTVFKNSLVCALI